MSSGRTDELLESIDNRLKLLLRLEAEGMFEGDETKKDRVSKLYQLGFSNSEMAAIVDSSEGGIRSHLSTLRDEGRIDE